MPRATLMILSVALLSNSADAGDWPRFLGPGGTGVSDTTTAPTEWGPDRNIKWKAAIDGTGNGSPIVSGGRVFVAAAKDRGKQRTLLCFDRTDGNPLWAKTVKFDKVMPTHQTNPYAGTTPAADGQRVVVWHGSAGVHCYDFDGKELWSRDIGEVQHIWGYGASPIIHDGVVYLNIGPGTRQRMAALDLESGDVLWETPEPGGKSGVGDERGGWVGSWSTPVVATVMGEDVVVCSMPTRVNGYHPKTGEILWFCEGLENMPRGNLVYASPNISGVLCVVLGGFNGPSIGFEMGGRGNTTEFRLWRVERRNPQRIGTGVIVGEHLYVANAGPGTAECIEARTGKVLWEARLQGGNHWGSVVLAAGRLYVTNQSGTTHVFLPNPERLELIASNELDEPSNATPAISDGEVFLRTDGHLYCIAEE